MSQIVCKNLSVGYDGKNIIENINFTVNAGDYLCIIGSNGSGKTTLIKSLLGIIPVTCGELERDKDACVGNIGYLPQQTDVQRDFPACAAEIVLSECLNKSNGVFFGKKEKELAKSTMERLGILNLSKKSYKKLSGGQQQRVLLARALCSAEKMILLDEPVSGLDPQATGEMYELVKALNQDGMTVIMVSHDVSAVVKYATHVLCLGKAPFFGTKEECIERGLLEDGAI